MCDKTADSLSPLWKESFSPQPNTKQSPGNMHKINQNVRATIKSFFKKNTFSMYFRKNRGSGFAMLFLAILAPLAALVIQMAISRSREYAADKGGALLTGNPLGLASALEKLQQASAVRHMNANTATAHMFIVNPLSGRSLLAIFSTHPPIEERIKRLRAMA